MKLIVGLGNPGKKYENTRHNIGFFVIDNYVGDITWKSTKNAKYYKTKINNQDVIFLKPLTYMNLSGQAVNYFINYYKISLNNILIIHDDLDIAIGKFKLKKNSGSGGHNGIKSIISVINSDAFLRFKIGISKPTILSAEDYVLQKFSPEEINIINSLKSKIINIINDFIINEDNNHETLLNKYNRRVNEFPK